MSSLRLKGGLSFSEKTVIYILGTSRERGVFLSLVDLLLSAKEKKVLSESVIGKCWGRAVVTSFVEPIYHQLI